MDNKVNFLRGTSAEYEAATKDNDTFYYTTDTEKLYLGNKEITGGGVTIDDSLSDTSKNPVQNKVITNALNTKANLTDIPTTLPANGGNADTVDGLHAVSFLQNLGFWSTGSIKDLLLSSSASGTVFIDNTVSDMPVDNAYWFGFIDRKVSNIIARVVSINNKAKYSITYNGGLQTWYGWVNEADGGNAANAQSLNGFTVPNSGLDLIGNPTASGGKPVLGVFDDTNGANAFYDIRQSNGDITRVQLNPYIAGDDALLRVFKYIAETDTWTEGLVNKAASANVSCHQIEFYLADGTDILSYIASDMCPAPFSTVVRIMHSPTCPTNYGYSASDNDFFYHIFKLDNSWSTVKAYDVRGNVEFINSCLNGTWSGWIKSSDGGNAATVNGLTVQTAVPANAKFTDTTYGAATASTTGLVTTGAQTFAGNKTFNGQVIPAGASDAAVAQARKIYAGTSDMTAGTTALETGAIYLVYE